jgi:hypothetical protein
VKSRQSIQSWIEGHGSLIVNASLLRSAYNLAVKRDIAEILNEALMLPLNEREALAKSLVASLALYVGADATDRRFSSNVGHLYEQARDRARARLPRGMNFINA